MSKTRGIEFLEKSGAAFETLLYECDVKGAEAAARATGVPLEQMIKTLVVKFADGGLAFVLMGGDGEVSMKKLAKAAGAKGAEMTKPADAERLTGYLVGGISPFGARKKLDVFMDETLTLYDELAINGGGRGVIVKLKTGDIIKLLSPAIDDLRE